ncbi:Hypothetical protein R9X50_00135000 [Acrodontium crateriforme]|uniref:Trafficking protein particle complex subunit 13 n=1 Tax=Acrodontium crateriforme TaxID=150365 RepID=A0AAQ3R5R6_9PEZI|nr:Hypothetical protein R9X50_00135000 [Acrodontium crateriforme]
MAYARPHLAQGKSQESHAISLKVLRLSRPSLAAQTPLPQTHFGTGLDIPAEASCAFPFSSSAAAEEAAPKNVSSDVTIRAPLTQGLTLPSAFGAAYVGEMFTCMLCANNEVLDGAGRKVTGVRIVAELQTPSDMSGMRLELRSGGVEGEDEDGGDDEEKTEAEEEDEKEAEAGYDIPPNGTIQKTLRHALKDEGPHVLAVTVSYTETTQGSAGTASGGRARSFRKLYQFVAQQAIAVRSKVTERTRGGAGDGEQTGREWILEAQLENVGESAVVLEHVWLRTRDGVGSAGVDDAKAKDVEEKEAIVLKPQDIEQTMFILSENTPLPNPTTTQTGRLALAQLNIDWRNAMGEKGSLTTGWLAAKMR